MGEKIRKAVALLLALCLCLCSLGAAEGLVLHKALASVSMPPVALKEIGSVTVTTSAAHCSVSGVTWYDGDHNAVSSGTFSTGAYRLEIVLAATDGYTFAEDTAGYINNSPCNISWDPSGSFVTLSQDYTASIWAPDIVNHPKAATVNAGEYASFWVSGFYVADYDWYLQSPEGEKVPLDKLREKFPAVSVSENKQSSLTISHIPAEMDGWSVVCTFISAAGISKKDTNAAKITVNRPEPTPTPSPEPTPEPEPTPQPEAEEPEAEVPEEEHEHSFSDAWSYDEGLHWHECACSLRQDELAHRFTKTDEEGRSVCNVCGYTAPLPEHEEPDQEQSGSGEEVPGLAALRWLLLAVAVALVIGIAALLVQSVQDRHRRRRRRRRR